MVHAPLMTHWWNVPLYVTARGLTTSLIPAGGRGVPDRLRLRPTASTSSPSRRATPRPIALGRCRSPTSTPRSWTCSTTSGCRRRSGPMPVEIPTARSRSTDDHVHAAYDRDQAERFWRALVQMDRVFAAVPRPVRRQGQPGAPVLGRARPRRHPLLRPPRPPHPGGAPNCGPHVMHEAYSHEVSSAGYWPGPDGEGVFYSYAYPEPDGYRDVAVRARRRAFDAELGEFVLPYELGAHGRRSRRGCCSSSSRRPTRPPPTTAGWDRAALERS